MIHLTWKVHVVALAFASLVVAPVTWWTCDRTLPFEMISTDPIPNPIHPGQVIDFQWVVKVNRTGCAGTYQRIVIDPDGRIRVYQPAPTGYTDLPLGLNRMHSTTPFAVPSDETFGDMEVYESFTLKCNPIHKWLWPLPYRSPIAVLHVK